MEHGLARYKDHGAKTEMKYFAVTCQTIFIFSLLVWLYVVAVQITHPDWLSAPMTHYDIPPFDMKVDDAGILSFALAALSFLLWRSESERNASPH